MCSIYLIMYALGIGQKLINDMCNFYFCYLTDSQSKMSNEDL